jgi:formamidopyrimidine-DNA glycosylase
MPEAPEVEAVARALRPLVRGRKIHSCNIIHAAVVPAAQHNSLARQLRDATIVGVKRRGKHLLLPLSRGCLLFHFRFDGRLLWFEDGNKTTTPPNIHVDVLFHLDRGTLAFVDPRHLGRVAWHANPNEVSGLSTLGPDALSPRFSAATLADILSRSDRPVKIALIDQPRIAGIGNIYSSESLWRARIDPRRAANSLCAAEVRRLHKGVVSVLRRALECCLNPAPDFRDPDWWFTGLDRILAVYGREGKPCRRCERVIRRIAQAQRSTFYCPGCQE